MDNRLHQRYFQGRGSFSGKDPDGCSKILLAALHPDMFYEKGALKNFAKYTGRCLWWKLFLNKGLREIKEVGDIDRLNKKQLLILTNKKHLIMFFNETVLNIVQNLIPHETVIFDDREPPWITSCIKKWLTIKIIFSQIHTY